MVDLSKYWDRKVVLVDESDYTLGEALLIDAHREPGLLHRAFSLVVYRRVDGKAEILMQLRSNRKPVFPNYWTNTCCYNMAPGEEYEKRVVSRAMEEMGIDIKGVVVERLYGFVYYAPDKDGWCEREYDMVMVAEWSGEVKPNPDEAEDYRWVEWSELIRDIEKNSGIYAPWWKMILKDGRLGEYLDRE